jgi:hypothetical protein
MHGQLHYKIIGALKIEKQAASLQIFVKIFKSFS